MIVEASVASFLDTLASPTATPGGGSTAAVMGAMAAALVSMVCSLSLSPGKQPQLESAHDMGSLLRQSQSLRRRLSLMIEADAEAYNSLMNAYTLPRGSDAERILRSEAIQQAMSAATLVPLECARSCADVMDLSRIVAEKGNPNAAGEAAMAALAANAALRGAALNVYINTSSIRDRSFVERTLAELMNIVQGRDSFDARVVALVTARVLAASW
jgi:methenyltetrahydrofolate cyclohydrolase